MDYEQVDVLNRQCKLANFGLNLRGLRAATVPDHDGSVLDGEEIEETGGSGTPMALAADIYAFGVLLFEILALHAVSLETAVETVPFPEQLSVRTPHHTSPHPTQRMHLKSRRLMCVRRTGSAR
jgi:hypothetical protein